MWYIFDTTFKLQGIMTEMNHIEIVHHYHEADTMYFETPYTKELFDILRIGRILYRKNEKKGFRIHSLEVLETDQLIIGNAYGLESILDQRVYINEAELTGTVEDIMHEMVKNCLKHPTQTARNIPFIQSPSLKRGDTITKSYYGESGYLVLSELAKEYNIGYRFLFDPMATGGNTLTFETYVGKDRTTEQRINTPVAWRNEWGDTLEGYITKSEKEYRNVVYLKSGDEVPIYHTISPSTAKGWDRFELFHDASDVSKTMFEGTTFTTAQIKSFLESRGKTRLSTHPKIDDYSFKLSSDITQVFGKDYEVGDRVSVMHREFGILKHARIISVTEYVTQTNSQYEIKFEEQE